MNDRAAGEVEHAVVAEEAAAPHPVGDGRINDDDPDTEEQQQCRKLHTIGDRAANQRRCDDREGHLEGHEHRFRDRPAQGVLADSGQERFRKTPHICI